jgi:hypothetical protein
LKPGQHFVNAFDEVKVYDTALPFNAPIALELLLRDAELASMLTIVEVGDNQLVLKYRNGNFQEVLKPGRYAFFKGLIEAQVHHHGPGRDRDQRRRSTATC